MITESQKNQLQSKIENMITTIGLLGAIKMVGGYSSFLKFMKGVNWRKKDFIIPVINEVIRQYENFLTMLDIDLNPIVVFDEDGKLCQIEALYNVSVQVYCYGGYKYETELDDYEIKYEELNPFDLHTIFDGLMEYYEN